MKDIGITVENIAIIYAILPFTSLVSSPIVGFLADKLGSYTKVLILTLLGDGLFYSLLLAVPVSKTNEYSDQNLFIFQGDSLKLDYTKNYCFNETEATSCGWNEGKNEVLNFSNCTASCMTYGMDICNYFNVDSTLCNSTQSNLKLFNMTLNSLNSTCSNLNANLTWDQNNKTLAMIGEGCRMQCYSSDLITCKVTEGNLILTNGDNFCFYSHIYVIFKQKKIFLVLLSAVFGLESCGQHVSWMVSALLNTPPIL